uniref:Uncharacterized protein n=1 Tax=Coptotermes formosanus TaxID=36987 RepID=R4UJI3_COPFO|nr:hypothetical protein [Coptotermes formosanus]
MDFDESQMHDSNAVVHAMSYLQAKVTETEQRNLELENQIAQLKDDISKEDKLRLKQESNLLSEASSIESKKESTASLITKLHSLRKENKIIQQEQSQLEKLIQEYEVRSKKKEFKWEI